MLDRSRKQRTLRTHPPRVKILPTPVYVRRLRERLKKQRQRARQKQHWRDPPSCPFPVRLPESVAAKILLEIEADAAAAAVPLTDSEMRERIAGVISLIVCRKYNAAK